MTDSDFDEITENMVLRSLSLLFVFALQAQSVCSHTSPKRQLDQSLPCEFFYELATEGTVSGRVFSGSKLVGTNQYMAYFDTPLYLTPNVSDAPVIGRVMGAYWPSGAKESFVASGFWNFLFFDDDSIGQPSPHWISANLGFDQNGSSSMAPNVITGGTGRYSGLVGSITRNVLTDSEPLLVQYKLCPQNAPVTPLSDCKEFFEWSSSGVRQIGDYFFSGSFPAVEEGYVGVANTPVFDSVNVSTSTSTPIGRLIAQYFLDRITTASGSFSFQVFDEEQNEDWVSVNFGFGPLDTSLDGSFTRGTPNIVVGGTGSFAGLKGEMRDRAVSVDPLVFLYEICPADQDKEVSDNTFTNTDECQVIYEWSTNGTFNGYQFSGSIIYGDERELGVFDTPFFGSPNVQNATVIGRVMGYYVPNARGATSGLWNFAYFDEESNVTASEDEVKHENWIAASLGFYQFDADREDQDPTPNVVTGGSGKFVGLTGAINSRVYSTEPFVIEWTICPSGSEDGTLTADAPFSSIQCTISLSVLSSLAIVVLFS